MHLAHIRGREAEKANALAEVQVCPHAEDAALTPASRWSFSLASPPVVGCVATQGLKEAMSMRKAEQEREQCAARDG